MDDTVRRLMESHRIDEMALSRGDAIDRCINLGKQFIEHFHKVYVEEIESRDFNHHCQEMQSWYDSVSSIRLKTNNKFLTNTQLIDWFFTLGANVEDYLDNDEEVEHYNNFIVELLSNKRSKKVVDVLKDILS